MKQGIAALLALVMVLGGLLIPVTAASAEEGTYGVDYVYYGDLSGDQKVDASDALVALKAAVKKVTLTDVQTIIGDVNVDTKVDASDALLILKLAVKKITEFPAGTIYQLKATGNYIADYNKSNSVNGAYVEDPTADTSFSADVSSLEPNTIYRLNSTLVSNVDRARLIFSLQGLINRDFGKDENHTSLLFIYSDASDGDWFDYVTAKGNIMYSDTTAAEGMNVTRVRSYKKDDGTKVTEWDMFLECFGEVIKSCGLVLWDGNVPATANVAATICGLDGYLPVLAKSPLHTELADEKGLNVPVKQSLVGLFQDGKKGQKITGTSVDSTGSAKNDAYLWALEKYFARCTCNYLAYTLDGACCVKGYSDYTDNPTALLADAGSNCLQNHDYLIARRCFFYDLAVYKEEAACDDPAQKSGAASIGEDNKTMRKIFAARYKRANGAMGALMGFPPWWLKYTDHHAQGSKVATWIEWLYTEYITCYNLAKEADAAQPSSMTNGSVYYKYVPHKSQYTNNHKTENISFNSNIYYYTIYVGDYDSSAWLKKYVDEMWVKNGGDRKRGTLPLMWCYNPNLSYRVPMCFDYVYENMSDKDYFAAGDSGAGYIIPEGLFHDNKLNYTGEYRPAENADAGQVWADYCKAFYKRFDMTITGFIINGNNQTCSKSIAACFNQFSTTGSITNCIKTMLGIYQGVPYLYCQNGIASPTSQIGSVPDMYSHAYSRMAGYNFGCYRTVGCSPTVLAKTVDSFETYAAEKGKTVKFVDPYTLFKLIGVSGQGTQIK